MMIAALPTTTTYSQASEAITGRYACPIAADLTGVGPDTEPPCATLPTS